MATIFGYHWTWYDFSWFGWFDQENLVSKEVEREKQRQRGVYPTLILFLLCCFCSTSSGIPELMSPIGRKVKNYTNPMSEKMSRRDFLIFTGGWLGSTAVATGITGMGYSLFQENKANNGASEIDKIDGIDNDFYKADATNIPPKVDAAGAAATITPYPGAKIEITPTEPPLELKSLVDKFTITDRINLAGAEPMKWLFVFPKDRVLLTPTAKPYAFSQENETANVFDWRNHTTYTYLDQNETPILWGHEGTDGLFFNSLADFLRKPDGNGWVTRAEAEKAMRQNLLGTKVYLIQGVKESMLPKTPKDVDLEKTDVRIVEMEIVAGLFIPRWQNVDVVDELGQLTPDSKVTFDGSGHTVDWVTQWYNKHTNDIYEAIRQAYPDNPNDPNNTYKQFASLPDSATLGVKFCMRPLSDDIPAPKKDADGNSVITPSYGRFFMVLKATRATSAKIPAWDHQVI